MATPQCPAGSSCQSLICVEEPPLGCQADSDCTVPGTICNRAINVCIEGCRGDAQCPEGTSCINLTCVFAPECLRDSDCAAGEVCSDLGACEQGQSCRADDECGIGPNLRGGRVRSWLS